MSAQNLFDTIGLAVVRGIIESFQLKKSAYIHGLMLVKFPNYGFQRNILPNYHIKL